MAQLRLKEAEKQTPEKSLGLKNAKSIYVYLF